MTLLSRTKEISKKRGLSLDDVAIKAGLSSKSIYQWDRSSPKSENLDKVANVLNVSTDYLLGRTNDINLPLSEKVKQADIDDSDLLLAFDGKDIDEEDKKAIIELLRFRRYQKQNGGN